jgi:hypothetical protein
MGCAFSKLAKSYKLRFQGFNSGFSQAPPGFQNPTQVTRQRSECHSPSHTQSTQKLEFSQVTSVESEADITHFKISNVILGVGGFGIVQLIERTNTISGPAQRYAMKSSSKESVLKRPNGVNSVMSELRALSLLKGNNFICNIQHAFQDEIYLYLVLELATGGDMRVNMRLMPSCKFPEHVIQFYACQLFLAMAACHRANILHRGNTVE